ncbi:Protein hcp1 [Candidatus Sulfopaludibacter sp. SbA3]|nr:Protein hcp1 [Candidatus Sulfopaludibacter sp. SbA3]
MAFDSFLKLDGIKGESADAKHKGEIDILSFSFGASQTGTHATGGGGGAGKVQIHDIQFTKKVDASSPLLFLNCASGAHIKEATLVVRKAGGQQLEFLKIKLTDVLISSVKPHGSGEQNEEWHSNLGLGAAAGHQAGPAAGAIKSWGDEVPFENLSLNFAKIEYSYQPQGADGKAQGGPILAGWDVKGNQKI